jgi:beta-glucosidase
MVCRSFLPPKGHLRRIDISRRPAARGDAGRVGQRSTGPDTPWLDQHLPPEERATDLVAAMTLDEKITELHGISDDQHKRYVPGVPRLSIPPLRIANGPAGVGPADDPQQKPATALPAPISLASTFDTNLAKEGGSLIGSEAQDLGHNLLEGPDINIARVPVSGRTFEGYGEDPYLAGQLAAANIEGIQRNGVIAEVKRLRQLILPS